MSLLSPVIFSRDPAQYSDCTNTQERCPVSAFSMNEWIKKIFHRSFPSLPCFLMGLSLKHPGSVAMITQEDTELESTMCPPLEFSVSG